MHCNGKNILDVDVVCIRQWMYMYMNRKVDEKSVS